MALFDKVLLVQLLKNGVFVLYANTMAFTGNRGSGNRAPPDNDEGGFE